MEIEHDLARRLAGAGNLDATMLFDGRTVRLETLTVSEIDTPVSETTMRGGVYRAGRRAYRIQAVTSDQTILPALTGKMLGPSTEFSELEIRTSLDSKKISLFGNLVGTVQGPGGVRLNLDLVGTRSG